LFFWVARMVMTGLHFTDRLPFATVHLTGLVRDPEGRKMSKTRGNVVDPLELVDEYGADALRFTLAALDSPGRDIPLDRERMAGYRAFGNKIWNAVRFSLSRTEGATVQTALAPALLAAPERWILSRLSRAEREVNAKLEAFRFDEACRALYAFFWGELCDWYIELVKPALGGEAPRPQVGEVLLTALERSLRLLHPVMPFLTEELWQRLPGHQAVHAETIVLAPYPAGEAAWEDASVEEDMGHLMALVTWVRNRRAALGLAPKAVLEAAFETAEGRLAAFLEEQAPVARALGGLASWRLSPPPPTASSDRVGGVLIGLDSPGRDLGGEERARVDAELAELSEHLQRVESLLADPSFLARAPGEVVERNRSRLTSLRERRTSLEARSVRP
ncbi:MAG: class I tRNA ligase family protein, partial [Thermoanaerobaculia bacterium]